MTVIDAIHGRIRCWLVSENFREQGEVYGG